MVRFLVLVWLVPQSPNRLTPVSYTHLDVYKRQPLTARGIEQAQHLHTLLHDVSFALVLCSELERAQHTARLVLSDRQHPVHIIPELNEMF